MYIDFLHSLFIFGFVIREIRRVEQKHPTLPEHPSSPLVLCGVFSAQSVQCFVDHCLFICPFQGPVYCLSFFYFRFLITVIGILNFFLHFLIVSCTFYLDSILFYYKTFALNSWMQLKTLPIFFIIMHHKNKNINIIQCGRRVSAITFVGHPQVKRLEKENNFKILESRLLYR